MGKNSSPITRYTPVLITSAIKASAPLTKLVDTRERLLLLADSLRLWATSGVSQIVVCDGSTTEIALELNKVINLSEFQCKFEILGFINSTSMVSLLGKGYGEGEIVNYAIKHSKALADSPYFVKCTGRLFVVNYWSVIRCFRGYFGASSSGFAFFPQCVDTRFYIASREFFLRHMANGYLSVNDSIGVHLENVYFAILINSSDTQWLFSTPPRYKGVSGSLAKTYKKDRLYAFRQFSAKAFIFAFNLLRWLKSIRNILSARPL